MSGYDAYSYNDIEGYYRKKLDLQIPAWVISKTLALLREKANTTTSNIQGPNHLFH